MKKSPARVFRLYVAGNAPNSVRARSNFAEIAKERLGGDYTLEEVDVLKNPALALADHILVTPTLILLEPSPSRRVIGNLSERNTVLDALGI